MDTENELINAAWERVTAASPAEDDFFGNVGSPADPDIGGGEMCDTAGHLREFIRDELADAKCYAKLFTKTCSKKAKSVFRAIAADEKRHARLLQAELFILTGDIYCPPALECSCASLPGALRGRYLSERRGSESYHAAANCVGEGRIASLLHELADDEARHAEMLLELIVCMMA